jgi:hypothetical protein
MSLPYAVGAISTGSTKGCAAAPAARIGIRRREREVERIAPNEVLLLAIGSISPLGKESRRIRLWWFVTDRGAGALLLRLLSTVFGPSPAGET